jgi:hypothetical protein
MLDDNEEKSVLRREKREKRLKRERERPTSITIIKPITY